jgi:hypothetical protein
MERPIEPLPSPAVVGDLEPRHLWVLGLAAEDGGAIVGPGRRDLSWWAECDCPNDCLRDHENE